MPDSNRHHNFFANRLACWRCLGRDCLAVLAQAFQMAAQCVTRHRARLVESAPEGNNLRECRKHYRETPVGLRLKIDGVVVGTMRRRRCHLLLALRLHRNREYWVTPFGARRPLEMSAM